MKCIKCKRILPAGSKEKLCENCRGKRAETIKTATKTFLAVCAAAGSITMAVITRGKIGPKNK